MIALLQALGMILLCLMPIAAVGLVAAWSHWEHTHR